VPGRQGDRVTPDLITGVQNALRAIDSHLVAQWMVSSVTAPGEVVLRITLTNLLPIPPQPPLRSTFARAAFRLPATQGRIRSSVPPVYPEAARQARLQGSVRFNILIQKDGTVGDMTLVSGHPLLVEPAQSALKQWVFEPILLNGQPVDAQTQFDVHFALPR
jgi:TonB family protein